jgi:hypothetical protein
MFVLKICGRFRGNKHRKKIHRQRNVLVKLREVDKRGRPSMVGLAIMVPDKSTADRVP